MICPVCQCLETKVLETRSQKQGALTRRRRECIKCSHRFSTQETTILSLPFVVKKDGRREPFSNEKLLKGIKAACQKRPISPAQMESIVDQIADYAMNLGEKEILSDKIGKLVMDSLKSLDEVAYIRFASVYRTFKDINEFVADLESETIRTLN